MRPTLFALAAFTAACGGPNGDTDTDTDTDADIDRPLLELCDLDGDRWLGPQCGGPDCDDQDPLVHPAIIDTPGDGVDRNCDGHLDLSIATLADEPFQVLDGWAWDPDLGAFGGVIRHLSGGVGSREIQLAPVQGLLSYAVQTNFFVELGPMRGTAARLWATEGPLDVFQVEQDGAHALVAWSEGVLRILQVRAGDAPEWLHAATTGSLLDVATCDGETLAYTRLQLDAGQTARHTIPERHDRCVVLESGSRSYVVGGTAARGPISRYEIGPDGFRNRLQIAGSASFELATAATAGGRSVFAYADGARIHLFDASGDGSFLDVEGTVTKLDTATDGEGNVALVWTTQSGTLGMAWGEVGFALTRTSVDGIDPTTPIVAGVDGKLLAVAWVQGGRWRVARSLIPQFPN